MKNNIIVGIGELLWDIFPEGKILGGAPVNFAYHVSQFGFEGYGVSAVGDDELGKEIIRTLQSKNMNCVVETVTYPTGTVQVTLDDKGVPQYEICENVAWDNIPFSKAVEDLAKRTTTVCFGSLAQRNEVSRNTINKFLDALDEEAFIIFDINLRQHFYTKSVIEQSLNRSNILKINDDEVIVIGELFNWQNETEVEICTRLMNNYNLKMVVLTKGTEGSYVITKDVVSFKPTPVVEVADTVGAGDSFTAGFVAGLLHGKTLDEAHQLAVDVSAHVCTQHGAMPALPEHILLKLKEVVM